MIISSYRLLASYYAKEDSALLDKFMQCANKRHYFDPHLYMPKEGGNIVTKFFKNKKVSYDQFMNLARVLVCAVLLVQRQVQFAVNVETNEPLLLPAACMPIDYDEIEKWIMSMFGSRLSPKDVETVYNELKPFVDLNWNKPTVMSDKFKEFHYLQGYCYNQRKEYKLQVSDNDKKFIGCFLNRKDDLDEFVKFAISNGPKEAFVEFKEKGKCVSAVVAVARLQAYGGVRTQQFNRFIKKWELNNDIKKLQPDHRK